MQTHTTLGIAAIFWPISTCWLSKCMYLSWEIQWWYFQAHSRTHSHNFMQFSHNITQFWLFLQFFGKFQHVAYKKHVLKLRNQLVVLTEAIGLKKGGQRSPIPRALCKSLSRANKLLIIDKHLSFWSFILCTRKVTANPL